MAYRGFENVSRTTLAGGVDLPLPAGLEVAVEVADQSGTQWAPAPGPGDMDIAAWFLAAHLRWGGDGPLRRVDAGVDWHSGDDDPADSVHTAFSILYGSRHKFRGFADRFPLPDASTGDRGLVDALLSTELAPGRLVVDVHYFLAAARRDGEGRHIGWELDLRVPLELAPGLDLEGGYSIFFNRSVARSIGLGDDGDRTHWLYLQLTASF